MNLLKWSAIGALAYGSFVVLFESVFLGIYQPSFEKSDGTGIPMIKITTTNDSGESRSRMLARFEARNKIYVSAHHWTRRWYKNALKNPYIQVEINGDRFEALAMPVSGEEFKIVAALYPLPLVVKFLMGFPPPRQILHIDTLKT